MVSTKRFDLAMAWFVALALAACSVGCSGKSTNNDTSNNSSSSGGDEGSCARGSLDCACDEGNVCGLGEDGAQLACLLGVCSQPPCVAGAVGCPCAEGACGEGLECSSASGVERCEVTGCELGSPECGCQLDRGCDLGATCQRGVCEALDCAVGEEGCACSDRFICDANLKCDLATDTCTRPGSCTPGNLGCSCDVSGGCAGELQCVAGQCADSSCQAGLEGCACLDGQCGESVSGELLSCNAGVCESMNCSAGSPGCVCRFGSECDDTGVSCVEGYCKPDACIPGTMGCECLAGSCNGDLTCKDNSICISNVGQRGGACKEDGTCERNNRCDKTVSPEVCTYCDLGTIGCQCDDSDSCNAGLSCVEGHCVGEETIFNREVPADPTCYTPCKANLVTPTEVRVCEDGLLEGCLDGMFCDRGTCVQEGGQADVCFEDNDCALFQLCIQGYCYAECEVDSECGEGTVCRQKVCRTPCSLDGDECDSKSICDSSDGATGYCIPRASPTGQSTPSVTGSTSPSKSVLEFSNTKITETFTLRNDTDNYVDFTIRKVEHNVLFSDKTAERTADYDPASGCVGSACPLWWVELGESGAISADKSVTVRAAPHCGDSCPSVTVRLANNGAAVDAIRWRGIIEVESSVGSSRINLSYASSPEGRWAGKMYYFADFETGGIDTEGQITGWLDRADRANVLGVKNGLIQRWGAFRNGDLNEGWHEMKAVLTSTQSGQWRWPTVQDSCFVRDGACYLFEAGAGALPKVYVTSLDAAPIPTGVSEFPMAVNLYVPGSDRSEFSGRVVSEAALHYPGSPRITMSFGGDPADVANCDPNVTTNCVSSIQDLNIELSVGGRYGVPATQSGCPAGFELSEVPWLVPGFLDSVGSDGNTGFQQKWCVDARLPYFDAVDPARIVENKNLAWSNPVPNGDVLERRVELLDGAMIDQSELFILFRERYPSFLGDGEDVVAYGYMVMSRQPTEISTADEDGDLIPDEYAGSVPPSGLDGADAQNGVMCSRDLLDDILGRNVALSADNADDVIVALVDGGQPAPASRIVPGGNEEVHYVCLETGLFDGGSGNSADWGSGGVGPNEDSCVTSLNGICEDGGIGSAASSCAVGTDLTDCGFRYSDTRVECPTKSSVVYFTTNASILPGIHNDGCNRDGTCMDRLNQWIANNNPVLLQLDPKWTCEGDRAFCDDNELDRRHGKIFYKANTSDLQFLSLRSELAEAFRYKTRFVSRDGDGLGFVPSVCEQFSTTTPYCYDPASIEEMRGRIDCLLDIYDRYYDSAAGSSLPESNTLYTFLEESFSIREEPNPLGGLPRQYDGFERLYAELLIMLGDDAYTSAFESRFDLAGSLGASFEGSKFEKDGLDLSGIAGYEMFKLYQAVQYYDMVLDRFYAMGDVLGASLRSGSPAAQRNFISSATVTSYFDRLIRASTQRSRASAEIARRYQYFNRPDLARRVAERAYTATYLESVILANLIVRFYDISGGSEKPQILAELETSQLRYRVALTDLVTVYDTITKDINYFGYPADYVPFPSLDNTSTQSAESNAFEKVLRSATSKLDVARNREQAALSQTRTYETDEASFQAELTRISRTYENQLGEICGTFQAPNGLIYPAVERYAYLDPKLSVIGDPCGFGGNGQIHNAMGELNLRIIELRQLSVQAQTIFERIAIEKTRVKAQCDLIDDIATYNYQVGQQQFDLEEDIVSAQSNMDRAQRLLDTTSKAIEIVQCAGTECVATGPALAALATITGATEAAIFFSQNKMKEKREQRNKVNLANAKWVTQTQCDAAEIDSNATTAGLMLGLRDLELSMLSAEYRLNLALSEIGRLRQNATRVQLEWEEALALSVNVEAAKNDPNIRIYRNDSVINAEISFEDALREAYRLTLVYEYYTSQSYRFKDQLFLIRMVGAGDYNLENYIYDLSNAFVQFEEEYGIPDLRLEVLSLADDILQIPLVDEKGEALSPDERAALLRERLLDPGMLNPDGYLTVKFSTDLERLSPLTRNHKVFYVEANIDGNDNGDFLGRLYLRQVGTSAIRTVDDEFIYYRFPERTAVLNPFFNGSKQFTNTPELYRNYRLRELPLVNTDWELIINQRDEFVNQDINLNELIDVKLYLYYSDFTVY